MREVIGLDGQNGLLTGGVSCTLLAQRTDYKNVPEIIILYHHIPKVTEIAKDQNNCQTLISRAGTGGAMFP